MEVFRAAIMPTAESHGKVYSAVVGPFKTKGGAEYMAKYGRNNPHCRTVSEAEKCATYYRKKEQLIRKHFNS